MGVSAVEALCHVLQAVLCLVVQPNAGHSAPAEAGTPNEEMKCLGVQRGASHSAPDSFPYGHEQKVNFSCFDFPDQSFQQSGSPSS
jgi:hypothetical protein